MNAPPFHRTLMFLLTLGFGATMHAAESSHPTTSTPVPDAPASSEKEQVDLNTADIPTLEAIPEIGTDFANAVVASRPFRSVDDVNRILKLGPDKMKQLRAKLTVSPVPATPPTAPDPRTGVSKPPQANDGKAVSRESVSERYDEKPGSKKTPGGSK